MFKYSKNFMQFIQQCYYNFSVRKCFSLVSDAHESFKENLYDYAIRPSMCIPLTALTKLFLPLVMEKILV